MYRVLSILLCLGLMGPGFAQKVSVDISACQAMMDVVDALKSGKEKGEVNRQLDSILTTEPFVVLFRHYNRPFRPDHLPPDVFKRMILSLRFPEAYTAGEKERADQMLVYWKRFYERPEYYRKSITQLRGTNLQQLIGKGVRYAQSWLPPGMEIPAFTFYIIPNGGSGAFAIDSAQGHDFFQLPRDSATGLVRLNEMAGNIAHEAHHLGLRIDEPKTLSKPDSLAFRFLSLFIAEGTATRFVDNAPGGVVPVVNASHPVNFVPDTYALWKHYSAIEDSLFVAMVNTFQKIYAGRFNEDSISTAMRGYWLAGAIKGPAYFVGAELYGVVYAGYGKKGVFAAMQDPTLLFGMYNRSIRKNTKLKKAILIPEDIVARFERMGKQR